MGNAQKNILMVEDYRSLMEVTNDFLVDNGYTVETCSVGSSALEPVKRNTYKISILDIKLSDLIGIQNLVYISFK